MADATNEQVAALQPYVTKGRDILRAVESGGIDFTEAKRDLDVLLSVFSVEKPKRG